MDNSAGIEHFPERQLDMCRLGLGLYGVDPIGNRILTPVSTLKTTILQLRHVPKEETVGYSRKGILKRDSLIAAIPIGYADGLNRHLGRGACYCLVNGCKAPYVGNICMDVAMIDVTDVPNVHEGDTVEKNNYVLFIVHYALFCTFATTIENRKYENRKLSITCLQYKLLK